MGLEVKQFINSVFNSNTYVIHDAHLCIIVDIGDFESVKSYIYKNKLAAKGLFITHTHYDHIYGVKKFMQEFSDVPVYTSEFGKKAFSKPNWNFSRYHGDEIALTSESIKTLSDQDIVKVPGMNLQAISTPGHDKSCMTFRIGNNLFTGDSYIPGIKVIASFPNSNMQDALYWYNRLHNLSPYYDIYPGHGMVMKNYENSQSEATKQK